MFLTRLELLTEALFGKHLINNVALIKARAINHKHLAILKNNGKLKNLFLNDRCFIVGNGPSLENTDLHFLASEKVFTCNYFALSKQFHEIHPLAHFIMDSRFFMNDSTESLSPLQKTFSACSNNRVKYLFLNFETSDALKSYTVDKSINIHFIAQNPNSTLEHPINLCSYIPSFPTVIHAAICTALYMGFNEIYLIGCDCTGFVSYAKAYEKKPVAFNYGFDIDRESEKVINKNMTSNPIQEELRWYAQIFDDYEKLDAYCKENNSSLVNLTKGGVLTSIPHKNYDTMLKQLNISPTPLSQR